MTDLTLPRPTGAVTSEWIAAALRQAILEGEYKSGQPLPQDEVAARFGVSKIPAREALLQLKAEGLVTFYPNRGAVVSELSADEVDEIYAMRVALETLALRRALPNMTRADFVRLDGLITIMDDERDALKWSALNWEFHAALYRPCGMPRLLDVIRTLHGNVQRYVVIYLTSVDYHAEAQRQHRVILRACRRGDADAAADQLAKHLEQAAKKMTVLLKRRANEERHDHRARNPND
ncbi:MAG: GntR family transcriptional regulator [Thermoflexales bacterium]|nr:GntR family transcriptional regulator [Thermoflexales bacterium]MDW8352045.1 GntR family transcriptional regulator [Anaerolineae bacterium]